MYKMNNRASDAFHLCRLVNDRGRRRTSCMKFIERSFRLIFERFSFLIYVCK